MAGRDGAAAVDRLGAWPRYLVERLLLDTNGYLEKSGLPGNGAVHAELVAARKRLADAGCSVTAIEAIARYEWIGRILDSGVTRPRERSTTVTDRIDRVLTNKLWGTIVFLLVMLAVFSSIFIAAQPVMDLIGAGNKWLQSVARSRGCRRGR